jgi:hypothetical protein
MSIDYTGTGLYPLTGYIDPLADAVAWKRKNYRAYEELRHWARRDIENGNRPSIGLYAELLRRPWFANKLRLERSDVQFLINNNLRADLARLLNREYHLGFQTRKAKADLG